MYYNFTQEKRKKHVFHYYLSHCKSSDMGISVKNKLDSIFFTHAICFGAKTNCSYGR